MNEKIVCTDCAKDGNWHIEGDCSAVLYYCRECWILNQTKLSKEEKR